MSLKLRPYQQEAIAGGRGFPGVHGALQAHRSTLLVMPTGTGKTSVAAAVAEQRRHLGRLLVLADRKKLVRQFGERIERETALRCGIEMGDTRVDRLFMPDVVCASIQTLARDSRLKLYAPHDFATIFIDEADLAVADSYQAPLAHFAGAKIVGMTATPDRSDGVGLSKIFESIAYVYEIRDAIESGFLSPIRQKQITVDGLDLSRVRTTAGDLNERDLEAIMTEEGPLHGVVEPTLREAGQRPTIVFAVTVAHARALADLFNRYRPGCAAAVDGTMDADEEIEPTLRRFEAGEFQFLVNCALLIRGVDIPKIACVAMARPTKSRALYCQAIGRGTRLSPQTGKRDLLVLDFSGNAGRHALVSALDVLDGNRDEAVKKRARKILADDPEQMVLDAIEQAAKQLAEEQRRRVLAQATYKAVEVDPFVSVQTILGVTPRAGRWGGAPPTPKQLAALDKAGVPTKGMDRGQCSQLLDAMFGRREQNLCTFKQAQALVRRGFSPDVTFDDARRVLDACAAAQWQITPDVRARIVADVPAAAPALPSAVEQVRQQLHDLAGGSPQSRRDVPSFVPPGATS